MTSLGWSSLHASVCERDLPRFICMAHAQSAGMEMDRLGETFRLDHCKQRKRAVMLLGLYVFSRRGIDGMVGDLAACQKTPREPRVGSQTVSQSVAW